MTLHTFDRRVGLVLVGLALLLGLVVLLGSQAGLPAPHLAGQNGNQPVVISSRGPLTLTFGEPVQPESVEPRLTLDSAITGRFTWNQDGRSVTFWPVQPLLPNQKYTLQLAPGVVGQSGRSLRRALTWQVQVRSPAVVYLADSLAPEIWLAGIDGEHPRQLTSTGGKVFDFNAAPDGGRVVYSAQNGQQGIDLWEVDRQGGQPRLLLPCQADWCVNPAFSPDGAKIAYSRRWASLSDGAPPGVPRIWTLDVAAGTTSALYDDPNVGGYEPVWAPDGRHLAFFDGLSLGVRVLNIQGGTDFMLDSDSGMVGEWSPDSRQLIYIDHETTDTGLYVVVYVVDVQTQQVRRVLGEDQGPMDYSVPTWSPDGEWVTVSVRLLNGSPSKQIWRMRLDGSQREEITDDQLYTHAACRWDPAGQALVYQRLALGASAARPEVVVRNQAGGKILLLVEDASQPRWIP